jgi:hypothetical protein
MSSIPKIIIQTSRQKPEAYVVNMIRSLSPGWEYRHFDDAEVLQFFREHPLDEFPDPAGRFFSFQYGEHRADLFRYYYLYVLGGVYIDSDAMIQVPIEEIVADHDYFSVNSAYYPGTIFQGFLGCSPGHPILYEALRDLYTMENRELLTNFHVLCRNMYIFVCQHQHESRIKLFQEMADHEEHADVIDIATGDVVLIHYYATKVIPVEKSTKTM